MPANRLLILLAATALAACAPSRNSPPALAPAGAGVPASGRAPAPIAVVKAPPQVGVLSASELNAARANGPVGVIDVRSAESFAAEHISGALSWHDPATLANTSKDQRFVLY